VSFLKDADLISGETIAIDGMKSRAHNSKKANFNQKKLTNTWLALKKEPKNISQN
jgi:transposase